MKALAIVLVSYHFQLLCVDQKGQNLKYWEPVPTSPARQAGVGAVSQPLIVRGERSLLLTRIAATESVSSFTPMKADCVSRTLN